MSGPYVINNSALLQSLIDEDAVIPEVDKGYGVQCVGLVKYYAVDSNGVKIPAAPDWDEGKSVKDAVASGAIDRGTAIATFHDGKYPQKEPTKHACFFIEEQGTGADFACLSNT